MKTREEYIALIASHAEELQNTFGICVSLAQLQETSTTKEAMLMSL